MPLFHYSFMQYQQMWGGGGTSLVDWQKTRSYSKEYFGKRPKHSFCSSVKITDCF